MKTHLLNAEKPPALLQQVHTRCGLYGWHDVCGVYLEIHGRVINAVTDIKKVTCKKCAQAGAVK